MNGKSVLITGINGYVGKHLAQAILNKYPQVRLYGVDYKSKNRYPYVRIADIAIENEVLPILNKIKPNYIFHMAGVVYSNDWNILFEGNVNNSKLFFDYINKSKINVRIIIPGSAAEYGKVSEKYLPVNEKYDPIPDSFYGLSKFLQSKLSMFYAKKGMDIVVGRIFNFIGSGMSDKLAIGSFQKQIMSISNNSSSKNIIEVGNLSSKRDLLDIEDVCFGLIAIAKKGKRGEIFNICSGKSVSMRNILKLMISKSKLKVKVKINKNRVKNNDIKDIYGSNLKIISETFWSPNILINESIDKIVKGNVPI